MPLHPDISPELAKKGLEADARKGGTLPPAAAETAADPDAIAQKRRSRLLHIYITASRRLTEAEMDEIAALLPSASSIERRVTKERFDQPLDYYATLYGYAIRNLKKWLQIGREKTPLDLPPLDAPPDMLAWWTRNMKQRHPPRLLLAARIFDPTSPTKSPAQATAPALSQPSSSPPAPAADGTLRGTGYAAMIERATNAELVAWEAWQNSLKAVPFNASDEEMRRRAYDRACEQARKVLKDRDSGLAGDDEWGRWEEFEGLAQEHVAVLNQSLRSLPVRVATKLALPSDIFRRMADAWNAELDRVFDGLGAVEWRKALTDDNFQLEAA